MDKIIGASFIGILILLYVIYIRLGGISDKLNGTKNVKIDLGEDTVWRIIKQLPRPKNLMDDPNFKITVTQLKTKLNSILDALEDILIKNETRNPLP